MATVTLRGLAKRYPNGVRAVDGIDLEIGDGEFFALLGPSGCGKTTLLRTLAGLEQATAGTIHIGDRDVTTTTPGERDIAMVFQDYALFPHMSVTDNIAYPLRIKGTAKGDRHGRARDVAGELSLAELLDRRPAQLSGGQQQRVALARAIAARPQVFLFDEPLSNLDARLRLEARSFLKGLQQQLGVTTVFVTHDQAEALAMADRMAVMQAGHIRQVGSPREVFQRPANTFVAGFIGATPMNLLHGVTVDGGVRFGGFTFPASTPLGAGRPVVYGLRPEYAAVTPAGGGTGGTAGGRGARGRVLTVENLGVSVLVTVEVGDGTALRAVVPEADEPAVGTDLEVAPMTGRDLVYDADDGQLLSA